NGNIKKRERPRSAALPAWRVLLIRTPSDRYVSTDRGRTLPGAIALPSLHIRSSDRSGANQTAAWESTTPLPPSSNGAGRLMALRPVPLHPCRNRASETLSLFRLNFPF